MTSLLVFILSFEINRELFYADAQNSNVKSSMIIDFTNATNLMKLKDSGSHSTETSRQNKTPFRTR